MSVVGSQRDLLSKQGTKALACPKENTLDGLSVLTPGDNLVVSSDHDLPGCASPNSGFLSDGVSLPSPFVGLVGKCCLGLALGRELQLSAVASLQRWLERQSKSFATAVQRWRTSNPFVLWPAVVVLTIFMLAILAVLAHSFGFVLPAVLLFTIFFVALRFGNKAGLLATIAAAVVLQCLLYKPVLAMFPDLAVKDSWIFLTLVLGVCSSALFGRRKPATAYKPWNLP